MASLRFAQPDRAVARPNRAGTRLHRAGARLTKFGLFKAHALLREITGAGARVGGRLARSGSPLLWRVSALLRRGMYGGTSFLWRSHTCSF